MIVQQVHEHVQFQSVARASRPRVATASARERGCRGASGRLLAPRCGAPEPAVFAHTFFWNVDERQVSSPQAFSQFLTVDLVRLLLRSGDQRKGLRVDDLYVSGTLAQQIVYLFVMRLDFKTYVKLNIFEAQQQFPPGARIERRHLRQIDPFALFIQHTDKTKLLANIDSHVNMSHGDCSFPEGC